MAAVNLKAMDVDALLALRGEIDDTLEERSRELKKQLSALETARGRPARGAAAGSRSSALKGVKVAPKYRGPNGETWAGRGAHPKWLSALLDEGHSLEEFAIEGAGEVEEVEEKPARKSGRGRRKRG
ncbi:H-NS histone family protein [Rhodoplanes sp. TEM]|uniref:H-NS histone family protein n=1 Tax=Rhodoplanes tepidamans TaxID=200616 RepID=A0ABT5JGF7_RHOTP|nr:MULTISPECIES: H-NS histone family protein [Rhodoplanes]MDC7788493.1 H-NS histone family protein [Rhodoplanes tepidamans]MDC7984147.1 H-NS histone family protein [Rhodoplanes sp. TEM]MDQ0356873.1 DNA-binding protein H-NS [Rhodoplanes tepidamans]